MITVDLPADIQIRLEAQAKLSGRTIADFVRTAVVDLLEDVEDVREADLRMADRNEDKSTDIEELMTEYGITDEEIEAEMANQI